MGGGGGKLPLDAGSMEAPNCAGDFCLPIGIYTSGYTFVIMNIAGRLYIV